MNFDTSSLKSERQWRSATGMDQDEFEFLAELYTQTYQEKNQKTWAENLPLPVELHCIKNETELLLFTLFSLKSNLVYDNLGLVVGMSPSNAYKTQQFGLGLLQSTLQKYEVLPRRNFEHVNDFKAFIENNSISCLLIDATEQRKQRPQDREIQKEYYSGKKKAHTVKTLIMTTEEGWFCYVSPSEPGKCHDFTLMKKKFSPEESWFDSLGLRADLGFLGLESQYSCEEVILPYKKPKNHSLTEEQKEENKILAAHRVVVEHSIGRMKRYRVLSDRLRIHSTEIYDKILGVCAGLWNFHLKFSDRISV